MNAFTTKLWFYHPASRSGRALAWAFGQPWNSCVIAHRLHGIDVVTDAVEALGIWCTDSARYFDPDFVHETDIDVDWSGIWLVKRLGLHYRSWRDVLSGSPRRGRRGPDDPRDASDLIVGMLISAQRDGVTKRDYAAAFENLPSRTTPSLVYKAVTRVAAPV